MGLTAGLLPVQPFMRWLLDRNSWQAKCEMEGGGLASASFYFCAVLVQIAREPIEKRGVPELAVLRLEDPVAFVRKNYEL